MSEKIIDCGDGVIKCRTCAWSPPGNHPVGCGMYLTVKDGKVVDVEGDEDHPITQGRLCVRCLTLPEYMLQREARAAPPEARPRRTAARTPGIEITLGRGARHHRRTRELRQGELRAPRPSWPSRAPGREATLYKTPLAYAALGTPNSVLPHVGRLAATARAARRPTSILGAGYPELDYAAFFPERYDDPRYEVPKYIVLWGKEPAALQPRRLLRPRARRPHEARQQAHRGRPARHVAGRARRVPPAAAPRHRCRPRPGA